MIIINCIWSSLCTNNWSCFHNSRKKHVFLRKKVQTLESLCRGCSYSMMCWLCSFQAHAYRHTLALIAMKCYYIKRAGGISTLWYLNERSTRTYTHSHTHIHTHTLSLSLILTHKDIHAHTLSSLHTRTNTHSPKSV